MRRRLGHCRLRLQRDRRLEHRRHETSGNSESCTSCGFYAREPEEVSSHSLDDPVWWAEARPDPQAGTVTSASPQSPLLLTLYRSGSLGRIQMLGEVTSGVNWQTSPSFGWR